ncbi:hypothetical protein MAM1_0161c06950 [Mucor ambiguus]|uniref:Uncharacterized protein n=1 Tax=Mucor ambiguus TaxID=91626 RepID=A0A0C9MYU8_9FUNG|nr:hypothetical protein MAM1_0161c06950 [Mucor ambiguus]
MGDTIPANNEEFFVINRGAHWRLLICPACDAAHFRNYKELIYHMAWPPNCFENIDQHNQIPEGNQIGPVAVPIVFPLRLILMLLWSIIWLCYPVYYIIVAPFKFIYNDIASVVHFLANFLVYVHETPKACMQFMRNLLGWLYRDIVAASAATIATAIPPIPGYFQRLYQNTRGIAAYIIVPFGWSILTALYLVYHYILEVPYIYISYAIASAGRYIAGISKIVSQCCIDAVTPTFQAVYAVYQDNIMASIGQFCNNYIEPLIDFARCLAVIPGKLFQQARHLIIIKIPTAIDGFIGSERAFVQRVSLRMEDKLRQIYQGIEWLNSVMYSFIYFPVDIPAGTPFWMSFVYRAFFCIHVIILVYLCICYYIQLGVLYVSSNVVYVE